MSERMAVAPRIFEHREIVAIISGLLLAMLLAALDQTIIATALSTLGQEFSGWGLLSWVVSGYLVTTTTTTPIYGKLSDLYGRRRLLQIAIGIFVLASIACALAQSMAELVAARAFQGVGGGGLLSLSQAVVADIIPPRERGRYQGYFASVFAVSSIAGPALGGIFIDYLSWRWIFWINVPLGIAAFAICSRTLARLPRPSVRRKVDWLGSLLMLASVTPILIGVSQVEQSGGWNSPIVLALIGIGAVLMVGLILRERVAPEPILPPRLFGNSVFSISSAISFLMSMVMIAVTILLPLNYQLVAGASAREAGLRLIPLTVCIVVGAFVSGQWVTRTGRYKQFPVVGAILMAAICLAIAAVGLARSLSFDLAATALLGVSFGLQLPTVLVALQNGLAARDVGVGTACVTFFRSMGGALGVALLSTVLIASLNAGAIAVPGHEVLGPTPGLALFHLHQGAAIPAELSGALVRAIRHAFSNVFLTAAIISVATAVACLGLKEVPLRGRESPQPTLASE